VTPGKSGGGGVYPSGGEAGGEFRDDGVTGGEGAPVVGVECDEVL
jgi:hypothetical protein